MTLPVTPTPALPVDDAIIETAWGAWAHQSIVEVVNPPHARVWRSASQPIPNNVGTYISFDTQREDVGGCWAIAQPTRLVAPASGFYLLGGQCYFGVSSAGTRRMIQLHVNAVPVAVTQAAPGSFGLGLNATAGWFMTAGQYLEVQVYQDTGATINVGGAPSYGGEAWMVGVGFGAAAP